MSRAFDLDLRMRVVQAVDAGMSTRKAAARFYIGVSTAGAWVRLWRRTGDVRPGKKGNPGGSRLDPHTDYILGLIETRKDIALYEIAERLKADHGVQVQVSTIWYFLNRRGITFKKRQAMRPNRNAKTLPPPARPGLKPSPILIPNT